MVGIVEGRVAIVTGAGGGLGKTYALELARQGAKVVVNDIGANLAGGGKSLGPAESVVEQIRDEGGEAIVNGDDVSDFAAAERLVRSAIDTFGDLHILINNAGILRDRTIVNMSIEEWDAVIRVHMRGTFSPLHHAGAYWREVAKAGTVVDRSVINTTSASGLYCNPGQVNYGAAKAGIAAMTIVGAQELDRYHVRVNAVSPGAMTRMTESVLPPTELIGGFDPMAPDNVAPLVVYLGSESAAGITGRVFNANGGTVSVAEGWKAGPGVQRDARWTPQELAEVVPRIVGEAQPNALITGALPEAAPA